MLSKHQSDNQDSGVNAEIANINEQSGSLFDEKHDSLAYANTQAQRAHIESDKRVVDRGNHHASSRHSVQSNQQYLLNEGKEKDHMMQELKMRESLYKQSSNLERVNKQNATLHLDEFVRKQMTFFTKHIDKLN